MKSAENIGSMKTAPSASYYGKSSNSVSKYTVNHFNPPTD